jgi:hypothetical protein
MKAITISENGEMIVNGTPVSSVEELGFPYTYLNYEPENGNLFKFTNNADGDTVRVDLTADEQTSCSAYADSFVPTVEPSVPEQVIPDPVYGHKVSADGRYEGYTTLAEGDAQANSEPPRSDFNNDLGVAQRWTGSAWEVTGGYKANRKIRYLNEVGITDQIAVLMDAVQNIIAGEPPTAEFSALSDKISQIKLEIPKE